MQNDRRKLSARRAAARTNGGFTLLEVAIVLTVIAILTSLLRPQVLEAKIRSNETGVVANLRAIHSAELQAQVLGIAGGAYASLAELTDGSIVTKSILDQRFKPDINGTATVGGYHYRLYQPDAEGEGTHHAGNRDPVLGGLYWSAYAWPRAAGVSGRRAFVIDHKGDVHVTDNSNQR